MASNRVGGPPPAESGKSAQEKLQAQQQKRVEKVEKVRGVDEVEQEQTRKKFQRYMEEEEPPSSHVPSPFETDFYFAPTKGAPPPSLGEAPPPSPSLEEMGETAVPSPPYAAPPDLSAAPAPTTEEDAGLPRSGRFWKGVDEPPDQPPKPPQFQETPRSSAQPAEKGKAVKGTAPTKPTPPLKEPLLGSPGKLAVKQPPKGIAPPPSFEKETSLVPKEEPFAIERRPTKAEPEKGKEKAPTPVAKEEEEAPAVRTMRPEEEKKGIAPFAAPEKGTRKEAAPVAKKGELFAPPAPPMGKEAKPSALQPEEKEGGTEKEKEQITQIEHPALPEFPMNIIPMAEAAASQATPYLSPAVLPLFYQMVGTVYVMVSQGISRTDIVLNAPSFANSIFYGSTISIEKYATAPDSLNIRLTGSTEAVTIFNQNIANLYAAFQNGNFNFRIGRIDAVYTLERPVFRRKEPREGKREFGGESEDRGKK